MRARGFSLVELSIVVLVIGIVLTMGIGAWTANLENQAHAATAQRQAAIKEALTGYLRRNSRLPCPDTDVGAPDGIENRTTAGNPATACSARFGLLPYVTLALGRDVVRDGWGNFFSYHVSNTTAAALADGSWGANTDWTISANFRSGNTGTITVNDRNGATVNPIATNVVAVIVSHGRNGFGAYTIGGTRNTLPAAGTDELDNTNGTADTTYFRREATTSDAATGGAFDDQVTLLTAADLLDPLFRDGSLRSPQAAVNESLQRMKQLIIGHAMGFLSNDGGGGCSIGGSNPRCRIVIAADTSDGWVDTGNTNISGNLPYLDLGLPLPEALDPWGMRYRYALPNAQVINTSDGISSSSPAASTIAFTITSWGPDRGTGGALSADDISLSVSVGETRSFMVGLLP